MKNFSLKRMLLQCHIICQLCVIIGMTNVELLQSKILSFHTLFPMTWYEKTLNATVSVWHKICAVIDDCDEDVPTEVLDIILGRFAFAHFCLEKMYQQKQCVIDEDIIHLANVLHLIETRLIENSSTVLEQERLACLSRMVKRTKDLLHPPSHL